MPEPTPGSDSEIQSPTIEKGTEWMKHTHNLPDPIPETAEQNIEKAQVVARAEHPHHSFEIAARDMGDSYTQQSHAENAKTAGIEAGERYEDERAEVTSQFRKMSYQIIRGLKRLDELDKSGDRGDNLDTQIFKLILEGNPETPAPMIEAFENIKAMLFDEQHLRAFEDELKELQDRRSTGMFRLSRSFSVPSQLEQGVDVVVTRFKGAEEKGASLISLPPEDTYSISLVRREQK